MMRSVGLRGRAHDGRLHRAVVAGVVVVAAAAGLSACHRPDITPLNSSVDACFRAIPVAKQAVNDDKAMLLGVHRLPADKVDTHLPPQDRVMLTGDTVVCAVSYKGSFTAGQVAKARPTAQGPYAVVLVSSKKLQLVASYVLTRLPERLGGRFT